jgi:hypothetical protein
MHAQLLLRMPYKSPELTTRVKSPAQAKVLACQKQPGTVAAVALIYAPNECPAGWVRTFDMPSMVTKAAYKKTMCDTNNERP